MTLGRYPESELNDIVSELEQLKRKILISAGSSFSRFTLLSCNPPLYCFPFPSFGINTITPIQTPYSFLTNWSF